jgi:hypothetical protein
MTEITIVPHKYYDNISLGYRGNEFLFRIAYAGPAKGGQPIVDQGWRLYEVRWHKTRFGRPVRSKNPRYALISVHETRIEAEKAAMERYGPTD